VAAGKEEAAAVARARREKEGEERKKEERGVRSRMPVQVKVNPANRTGVTGGHAV
jgi:hypothetical protein